MSLFQQAFELAANAFGRIADIAGEARHADAHCFRDTRAGFLQHVVIQGKMRIIQAAIKDEMGGNGS